MRRTESASMPPELRAALAQQPPEVRRDLAQVWDLLGHADAAGAEELPDGETAWAALTPRLAPAPQAPRRLARDRAPRRRTARMHMRWVAVVVLLLAAGAGWWRQPVVVTVPAGAQQRVHLPDGSTAELNSGTRLRYRRGFAALPFVAAAERVVQLDGEAFFDVAHEAGHPFVVETFNARVEVLGTRFNVRARRDAREQTTQVTLAAGRVRVEARQTAHAVTLAEAGAAVQVADTTARLVPHRPAAERLTSALAWREQGFAAVDQPLPALLAEVERRYALTLEVEAGVVLDEAMSVFYLHGTTAEQIIHDICLSHGWQYRRTSRGFAIFPARAGTDPDRP